MLADTLLERGLATRFPSSCGGRSAPRESENRQVPSATTRTTVPLDAAHRQLSRPQSSATHLSVLAINRNDCETRKHLSVSIQNGLIFGLHREVPGSHPRSFAGGRSVDSIDGVFRQQSPRVRMAVRARPSSLSSSTRAIAARPAPTRRRGRPGGAASSVV